MRRIEFLGGREVKVSAPIIKAITGAPVGADLYAVLWFVSLKMPFAQTGTSVYQYQEHVVLIDHLHYLGGICRILWDSSSVPAFSTSLYCRVMTSKSRLCGSSKQASFVLHLPGITVLHCFMSGVLKTDFTHVLVVFHGRVLPVPVSSLGLFLETSPLALLPLLSPCVHHHFSPRWVIL